MLDLVSVVTASGHLPKNWSDYDQDSQGTTCEDTKKSDDVSRWYDDIISQDSEENVYW